MNKLITKCMIMLALFGVSNGMLAYEKSCKKCAFKKLRKTERWIKVCRPGKPLAFWHYKYNAKKGDEELACKVKLEPQEVKFIEEALKQYPNNQYIDAAFINQVAMQFRKKAAGMVIVEGHTAETEQVLLDVLRDFKRHNIGNSTVGDVKHAILNPQGAIMGRAEEHSPWGTEGAGKLLGTSGGTGHAQ